MASCSGGFTPPPTQCLQPTMRSASRSLKPSQPLATSASLPKISFCFCHYVRFVEEGILVNGPGMPGRRRSVSRPGISRRILAGLPKPSISLALPPPGQSSFHGAASVLPHSRRRYSSTRQATPLHHIFRGACHDPRHIHLIKGSGHEVKCSVLERL